MPNFPFGSPGLIRRDAGDLKKTERGFLHYIASSGVVYLCVVCYYRLRLPFSCTMTSPSECSSRCPWATAREVFMMSFLSAAAFVAELTHGRSRPARILSSNVWSATAFLLAPVHRRYSKIGSTRTGARQREGDGPSRRDALSSLLSYTAGAATLATTLARASISAADTPPERPSFNLHERVNLLRPAGARPHIIAHRGACGHLPEHTLQSYRLAIELGADYVEPDLVVTSDGHLVCLHDVELSGTTDVASRPEFANRRRIMNVGGKQVEGFFTLDFTLAEIKSLRTHQRLRMRSHLYDGLFQVPTFEEVVHLTSEGQRTFGRSIGIYAELKEPHFFLQHGLDAPSILVNTLSTLHLLHPPLPSPEPFAPPPFVIQCFDDEMLQALAPRLPAVPLVQLLLSPGGAATREARMGGISLLPAMAKYASGIGPDKAALMKLGQEGAREWVREAQSLGMAVHPWTFRREHEFVSRGFEGDWAAELRHFGDHLGVDGMFVEQVGHAKEVLSAMSVAREG